MFGALGLDVNIYVWICLDVCVLSCVCMCQWNVFYLIDNVTCVLNLVVVWKAYHCTSVLLVLVYCFTNMWSLGPYRSSKRAPLYETVVVGPLVDGGATQQVLTEANQLGRRYEPNFVARLVGLSRQKHMTYSIAA